MKKMSLRIISYFVLIRRDFAIKAIEDLIICFYKEIREINYCKYTSLIHLLV